MPKPTFTISKPALVKIRKWLRWGLTATKLAAIGTALTGAITAITSSISTGFAMTAAGATTYAAAKNIPVSGYDKTKHIPPVADASLRQGQFLLSRMDRRSTTQSTAGNSKPARAASGVAMARKRV